ncbi:hypothetical protein [Methanobrevibacter arboriphilus]|uniref:hypothetical protein n=1 Tax=Methanobrevibacter arboriphilus TaxID=39441 RepID=UPI000A548C3E|nr:hypothetical protein [Methanobrevibacter arboriphilus]
MKYEVMHDFPNRLRIRCGRDAFTEKEGYGLSRLFLKFDFINEIITSHRNGSLIIKYDKNKDYILDFINKIRIEDIKEAEPTEEEILKKNRHRIPT